MELRSFTQPGCSGSHNRVHGRLYEDELTSLLPSKRFEMVFSQSWNIAVTSSYSAAVQYYSLVTKPIGVLVWPHFGGVGDILVHLVGGLITP